MYPRAQLLHLRLPFGILFLLIVSAAILSAADEKPTAPKPRLTRVTPPEANAAVEVSVAINPTNPDHFIAASIARQKAHPGISNYAYVTTDAGRTWKTVPRENPHKMQQGDDVVTFTPDGVALHAFIKFTGILQARPKRGHTGIVTGTSKDGITWSPQVPVVELFNSLEPYEDKPWIRADHSKESPHRGNLYVAWTKFDVYGSKKPEHKSHLYFSRSRDAGKTFAVPYKISDQPGDAVDSSDTLMGACPAVGPKGEVYVVWAGPKGVFFTRSTDGGVNFGKTSIATDCTGWNFPIKGLGRANGLPSIGVDITKGKDSGSVYVCWGDVRNGDADVFLIVSRDQGATWSKPLRVNADGKGKEQWFPWLAVDPVDGSVNVAYYDRGVQEGTLTDLTLARSVDGGQTFVHHKLNDEAYDLSKMGFFGDYLGLDCYAGRVVVLWMHPIGKTKQLGISSAVLDFEPGTHLANKEKVEKAEEKKNR